MQGTEKLDRELLDTLGLCGGLVREGSVHRFLAENRLRLFPDGLFEDLFGPRGRPSVPGSVIAVVMVLQALEGCSDREALERLRCDVRWKAAAGLGIDDGGFDASVLTLWRQRLRASGCPERIFDAVREVAAECGALSNKTMRALDSTVLFDAVATQDTVTMISAQIRRVRRLAPAAAGLVLGHDYDARARPVCDWDDPDERAWLIDDLVTDAQRVLDALDGSELTEEQAQAAALLAVVAGQDVEADPKVPGRWRIARRVVPGRVISTVDPEARHARKSRSRRSDGYKAHICAEPDTGLITAVELTTADTSDAQVGPRLLQQDPTAPHNTTDTTDTDTGSDTADTTDTDTGSDTADTTDTDTGSDTADTTDTDTGSDTADTTDTDTGSDTADTTDTDTGSDTADTTDTDTGSDTADTTDTDTGSDTADTTDTDTGSDTADTTDTDTGSDTADTTDTDTGSDTADTTDTDTGSDTADTTDTDTGSDTTDTDTGSDTADTTDTDTGSDTDTDTGSDTDTDTDTGSDTDTVDTAAVGDVGAEGFVGLVLADSAYASGEALDAFAAAGYGTAIKPIDRKPRIAGGFTRDDFTIDTDAQTVTCPAGHTKAIKSGAARFGALCGGCPLRARCTTSAAGRSVTVDEHHQRRQANKTRWAQSATQDAYRQHRPMAERSIAWLTRNKARRVPYRGVAANHLWLTTRAAAVNLTRLTNLGLTHNNGAFTL